MKHQPKIKFSLHFMENVLLQPGGKEAGAWR